VRVAVVTCCAVAALATVPHGRALPGRDDTAWLQARLDAGGTVALPKLPDGRCYATRGLWVSHDDTMITSDGACIVALGRGPARIKTGTGRPVYASAVFFVNHSDIYKPLPVRISIVGLRIVVPGAKRMAGVTIAGHEVTLDHVTIAGAPSADVVVGGGSRGAAGANEKIAIRDCTLSGGRRDVVSVRGVIGLHVERSTLVGSRGGGRSETAAGIDIAAVDRGQPTLDVHIVDNTIVDNAGPGILLDLAPKNGMPVLANDLELSGNHVLRNARRAPAARRAGIVLAGGESDGAGRLELTDNVVRDNRGPGLLRRKLLLVTHAAGNDLRANTGGGVRGRLKAAPATPSGGPQWRPTLASTGARDDTSWLQARLDAGGGTIFLPKLPDGRCYATRGLWVSHDSTTITSNGACVVSLGPGGRRLRSTDGDAIAAEAVFFVNRSRPTRPAPVHIMISNLKIIVPAGQPTMYGVAVFGHQVTLSRLDIGGEPKDDVLIGGRANGNGYAADVSVLDSTLTGAGRNGITAFGVVGLHVERNTISGVRDEPAGQPAAGIDVEPDDRGQPTLDLHIVRNTISDNAGPGVLLELDTNSGPAVIADGLELSGNTIVRNAHKRTPPKRAGVIIAGGQDLQPGIVVFQDNSVRDNGGPGVLALRLKVVIHAARNDLSGNDDGPVEGVSLGP
jgi:Right handed beta helix region